MKTGRVFGTHCWLGV